LSAILSIEKQTKQPGIGFPIGKGSIMAAKQIIHWNRYLGNAVFYYIGLFILESVAMPKPYKQLWMGRDREIQADLHREHNRQQRQKAWMLAEKQGWSARGIDRNRPFELQAVEDGLVLMKAARNEEAAFLTGTDLIRDPGTLSLRGFGETVGIWDIGTVRYTHLEFQDRVICWDHSPFESHSTHICGTLAATGLEPGAMGMAPDVIVHSYDSSNDLAEATLCAMSVPREPDMIQLSNHSYGWICGWDDYTSIPRWYGRWGLAECELFGQYDQEAQVWDALCDRAPYYLPVRAVGNDRDNQAPESGALFQYYTESQGWELKAYDPDTDPGDDGGALGGYDTICADASAKNMLSVGAVGTKRSENPGGDLWDGIIGTHFSGWGPTDDGRIKPDLVTDGTRIYSTSAYGDNMYETMTGTSMACGVACGSAVLLCELYADLFPGQAMRSSMLKGLLIHTAEDLGAPGPDYQCGWGLLRVDRAAEHLQNHSLGPDGLAMVTDWLDKDKLAQTYEFSVDTNTALRVTLCWTDSPGIVKTGLNDPTPCLVHDLDLRLVDPIGNVHEPYILNPNDPDQPVQVGDNHRDNVEQIALVAPLTGIYAIEITCKHTLSADGQYYSLLVTGAANPQEDLQLF
jgi:hypothetical protein